VKRHWRAIWRQVSKRAAATGRDGVPAYVGGDAIMIVQALASIWASFAVLFAEPSLAQQAVYSLAASALMGVGFLVHLVARSRRLLDWSGRACQLLTTLHAAALGLLSLSVITGSLIAGLHMIVTATAIAFSASVASSGQRPALTAIQVLAATAPVGLALLSGNTFEQVFGITVLVLLTATIAGANVFHHRSRLAERTTRSLDQKTRLLDTALNNMSHGLLMVDAAGRLVVWNRKLEELTGIDADLLRQGDHISSLLMRLRWSDGDRRQLVKALIGSMRSEESRSTVGGVAGQVLSVSRRHKQGESTVIVIEDITEQARRHEQVLRLAETDGLTGALNRTAAQTRGEALLARGAMAVHLIDLDHFKAINDRHGHPAGDQVLIEVVRRLRLACADKALVARLGGDEFMLLQPLDAHDTQPAWTAHEVLSLLSDPVEVDGLELEVGASIGIAFSYSQAGDYETLFKQADKALYAAKRKGRGQIAFYDPSMDRTMAEREEFDRRLAIALAEHKLSLDYQPIKDTRTGRIVAFEALARWFDPELGQVPPSAFIPAAEESGQIVLLGRWALQRACEDAVQWPEDVGVAVNFSAAQVHDRGFPNFVRKTLERTGLQPSRLEIEITETALLDHRSEHARALLAELREMGIKICLDDFGAGFSSLTHVRMFPFDKLKVDGSFVRELGSSAGADAVVKAVASMGEALGIPVVAECIENAELLRLTAEGGCTQAQGWHLGRPMSADAVAATINRNRFEVEPRSIVRIV